MNCWKPKIIIMIIMAISSEAQGSTVLTTCERSETRAMSSASNNLPHELPTTLWVDEIVPHSDESLRVTVNSLHKRCFTDWQSAHINVPIGDSLESLYGIKVQRLRIGPMLIDIIPYTSFYDQAALVQPQYIKWKTFTPLYFEMLARDGLRKKGQIVYKGYPEIGIPEAHWTFSGLAIA